MQAITNLAVKLSFAEADDISCSMCAMEWTPMDHLKEFAAQVFMFKELSFMQFLFSKLLFLQA